MVTMVERTNNGMLSILTRLMQFKLRDSTRTLVSMSIDHSIWYPTSHSTELLSATVLTMSGKEDGERILLDNNGSSMEFPRLLRTINGRITHLTSKVMEHQPTLDVPQPTQDGGNSSDLKVIKSSMREERFSRFKMD
jgi:hypothetical protein